MKSNSQLTSETIEKVKKQRKKRKITILVSSLFSFAILAFVIGFSGIITFNSPRNGDAYLRYVSPYVSTDDSEVGFKFVDQNSAIVSVKHSAYPCAVEELSSDDYALTVVRSSDESPTKEDEPSAFRIEFWEQNATVSWEIMGVEIKKVLSVTQEKNIPAGLWSLFATQDGDDAQIVTKSSGAGWTLILENGDSYTGEGMSSGWKSKFVTVGNTLLQCFFDPISGLIMDASVFEYDEASFGFPVIKEWYLSDGSPYYFYSKLLTDEEKIDFTGGEFSAKAVISEQDNEQVEKWEILDPSLATWRLTKKESYDSKKLDAKASLLLGEDGKVALEVDGKDYKGTWYALKHSVLVTLDKKCNLTGQVFTIYAETRNTSPSGELIKNYGVSDVDSLDCYRTGYHTFKYYIVETKTQIFWGNEWSHEKLTLSITLETPYVFSGEYFKEFFDENPSNNYMKDWTEESLKPIPSEVTLVFHENGKATFTFADGSTFTPKYTVNGDSVSFSAPARVYLGKNFGGTTIFDGNDNYAVMVYGLNISYTSLYYENVVYYGGIDENGETYDTRVVKYRVNFALT